MVGWSSIFKLILHNVPVPLLLLAFHVHLLFSLLHNFRAALPLLVAFGLAYAFLIYHKLLRNLIPELSDGIFKRVQSRHNSRIHFCMPADIWAKLQAIKASSGSIAEKRCEIHKVMMEVPDEVLDKMPEPKEFAGLPEDVKKKLKALHRQKDMPLDKKKEQLDAVIKTLTPEQQKLLVG